MPIDLLASMTFQQLLERIVSDTRGVLPYMGNIGMCGPKGYVFSAVLVINRASILANFGYFSHSLAL